MEGWGLAALLTFGSGIILGLLGGGGSMLIMPILLHVAHLPARTAIATSLIAVGLGAATGFFRHLRAGNVDWRAGILFGSAGMAGGWMGGRLAHLVPESWLVTAFAILMIVAAISMVVDRRPRPTGTRRSTPRMLAAGLAVGLMTGMVGAGGGFAVVPALAIFGGVDIQRAIGTSLLVIAAQSIAGVAGHLGYSPVDWHLVAAVSAASILGSAAGARMSGRIHPQWLRRGFAVLAATVAIALLAGRWLSGAEAGEPRSQRPEQATASD